MAYSFLGTANNVRRAGRFVNSEGVIRFDKTPKIFASNFHDG
jgi:hypothetical protein